MLSMVCFSCAMFCYCFSSRPKGKPSCAAVRPAAHNLLLLLSCSCFRCCCSCRTVLLLFGLAARTALRARQFAINWKQICRRDCIVDSHPISVQINYSCHWQKQRPIGRQSEEEKEREGKRERERALDWELIQLNGEVPSESVVKWKFLVTICLAPLARLNGALNAMREKTKGK